MFFANPRLAVGASREPRKSSNLSNAAKFPLSTRATAPVIGPFLRGGHSSDAI
jgi:hypothetical protein